MLNWYSFQTYFLKLKKEELIFLYTLRFVYFLLIFMHSWSSKFPFVIISFHSPVIALDFFNSKHAGE